MKRARIKANLLISTENQLVMIEYKRADKFRTTISHWCCRGNSVIHQPGTVADKRYKRSGFITLVKGPV